MYIKRILKKQKNYLKKWSESDVRENDWYASCVLQVNEQGIVTGYENKTFETADPITGESFVFALPDEDNEIDSFNVFDYVTNSN